jgi:hypothetical protein
MRLRRRSRRATSLFRLALNRMPERQAGRPGNTPEGSETQRENMDRAPFDSGDFPRSEEVRPDMRSTAAHLLEHRVLLIADREGLSVVGQADAQSPQVRQRVARIGRSGTLFRITWADKRLLCGDGSLRAAKSRAPSRETWPARTATPGADGKGLGQRISLWNQVSASSGRLGRWLQRQSQLLRRLIRWG